MPFKTDGSSHRSGIKNEKNICDFLNTRSTIIKPSICIPDGTVVHRGGTTVKMDLEILTSDENKSASIKDHQKKTSTFDWLNSSAAIPSDMKEHLARELKFIKTRFVGGELTKNSARTACNNVLETAFKSINSNFIKQILFGCYDKYTDYVIIHNNVLKELVLFDRKKNIPELRTYSEWTYELAFTSRSKTSARIIRISPDGITKVNTFLRLRLVLNNGVNALLGLSKSNKTSIPCIKIQQDNVSHFIDTLVDPLKEHYTVP
jgi:hypothetical protein